MNKQVAVGGKAVQTGLPDVIAAETAVTLDGLFRERVRRSPEAIAYRDFDQHRGVWRDYTWAQMQHQVARWQAALMREGLKPGDRVAVMMRNCPVWVMFDQAALGLALVVIPLYTVDRPDNAAYIMQNAGVKLLLVETLEQWHQFKPLRDQLGSLIRVLSVQAPAGEIEDALLATVGQWLPDKGGELKASNGKPTDLATIIYTSGTTGRPKGVMLSHWNMLSNAHACLQTFRVLTSDAFLSFLPLSHTFERTVGYYLTMMGGAKVVYARSIPLLAEDLQRVKPTAIISVPRIYERVYAAINANLEKSSPVKRKLFQLAVDVGWSRFLHEQKRGPWRASHLLWPVLDALVAKKVLARLGGRLRVAMAGGAALSPDVSRMFVALGVRILQGYGMTETSPVVCVNRAQNNDPASVGQAIPGVEVKLGEKNALLVKGPNVMLGYWNNPEATKAMFTPDGWLNTGDTARIDEAGRIFITGRIKEIIVTSTGEKVPPVDMESAIARDTLFEQVMIIGEGRAFLSALAVLNREKWDALAREFGLDPNAPNVLQSAQAEQIVLERIARQVKDFPGYAQVRRVAMTLDPWSVDNGLLTPTLKMRRAKVIERHRADIERIYAKH